MVSCTVKMLKSKIKCLDLKQSIYGYLHNKLNLFKYLAIGFKGEEYSLSGGCFIFHLLWLTLV